MTPQGTWTSPSSGRTYDQNWIAKVPGGTLKFTTRIADQEQRSPLTRHFAYYEGACTVSGTINGQDVTGYAYAEVMNTLNYARFSRLLPKLRPVFKKILLKNGKLRSLRSLRILGL